MPDVRFAVFSDLHYDLIPDGETRLKELVAAFSGLDVDFIIQLGDLCDPLPKNQFILERLASIGKPVYHMLGNHDCDNHKKEEVLSFFHLPQSYYSFAYGPVKFIVLDACFMRERESGIVRDYLGQAYQRKRMTYPYLPDWELDWLEQELHDTYPYYILLSHHSLQNPYGNRGIANREEVQKLIRTAEKSGKRILLCMNGHDHNDSVVTQGKTCFFTLNATSYIWLSDDFEHFYYPEELHAQYPMLKNILLYEEALYAIVTISENGTVSISGMEGHYRECAPQKLGVGRWNGRRLSSRVSSFQIKDGQVRFSKSRRKGRNSR